MKSRRHHGFTLLEVIIALVILGLISSTLFAIVRGSVKGASDIQRIQRENDQITRFLELCRRTFQSLPNSATLTLTLVDENSPESIQELGITGMATAFAFGQNPVSYQETLLGLRPTSEATTSEDGQLIYSLSISRADIIPPKSEGETGNEQAVDELGLADEEGRVWMKLLPGVSNLHWRFWKESTDEWLDQWSETTLPDLVEIQLLMEGRTTPLRLVFALPIKILREGRGQPQTTTTPSTPATSSSTGSQSTGNTSSQGQTPTQQTTPR